MIRLLAFLLAITLFSSSQAEARKVNIPFKGDSITYGFNASSGQGTTSGPVYPGVVMASLTGATFTSVNLGINGETCATMLANAASEMQPLIDPTALNISVILCGTNDIGAGSSAATVFSTISSYGTTLRSYGYTVVVMTVLPGLYAGMPTPPTFDTVRNTLNALLRSSYLSFADAISDPASDATIGCDGCENNPTYYSASDHQHPTDAGYAILGSYPLATLQRIINPYPALGAVH